MFSSCVEEVGSKRVGHGTAIWAAPPKPGFILMAALTHGTRGLGITGSFQALLGCTALLVCTRMLAWIQFPKQSPSFAPGSPAFTPSLPGGQWGDRGAQGTGGGPAPKQSCWWLYLLAGLQELLNCHHTVLVSVHFLKRSTAQGAWQGQSQPQGEPSTTYPGPAGAGHSALLPQPSPSTQ